MAAFSIKEAQATAILARRKAVFEKLKGSETCQWEMDVLNIMQPHSLWLVGKKKNIIPTRDDFRPADLGEMRAGSRGRSPKSRRTTGTSPEEADYRGKRLSSQPVSAPLGQAQWWRRVSN
jgi:hypothetical protein